MVKYCSDWSSLLWIGFLLCQQRCSIRGLLPLAYRIHFTLSFLYRKMTSALYFAADFIAAGNSLRKTPSLLGVHKDIHALWKQGLKLIFPFLQQHWENTALMLFHKTYRIFIYAQPSSLWGQATLTALTEAGRCHGQELKSTHASLLCRGGRIKIGNVVAQLHHSVYSQFATLSDFLRWHT